MGEIPKISVLLVDDHGLVRKGFRRILEDDPEIRVVEKRPTARRPSGWRANCTRA
jgi:DNA-binding NarL/FixJ family response regulator